MLPRLKNAGFQKRCPPFVRSRSRGAVPGVLDLEALMTLAHPKPEVLK
jgi:hypothetical protein